MTSAIHRKILVMGLPGAGKTTLATALARRLNAVHFNADEIRANLNGDLGFSHADRIEQARRMGWLSDQIVKAGCCAIADFVCPTPETLAAFAKEGDAFIVWLDRVTASPFEDTNRPFVPPERCHLRIPPEGTVDYWVEQAAMRVRPIFDPRRPTALFVGRYQPFHEGHKALIAEGLRRVDQAVLPYGTLLAWTTVTLLISNMFDLESSTRSVNLKDVSLCYKCRISRISITGEPSDMAWNGLILAIRWKQYRRPSSASVCRS